MGALYREDLDKKGCQYPACNCVGGKSRIFLHSPCHPTEPTWTYYHDSCICIICSICESLIETIVVASKSTR
jgi:hypothetical protein